MKLDKKLKIVLIAFTSLFLGAHSVCAQEITAIDFNGDLIGKVIPDGKVVSFENQLIGNITADSLILNFEGRLIGGVVPQGIAIGNDNRTLGKVNNDGTVRLSSGKIIGKVLPNGLVVDEKFMVLGSVLFPGLVYSDDGETVGRLTGDGNYANLQGQNIGFISPDGYAYRRVGNDYVLDGRLVSSKMTIDTAGNFVGSVTPGGKVTNFEGGVIASIHANGFAYDEAGKIIGRVIKSGYAFDNNGKYIGFVSYNGEVVESGKTVGRLQIDGSIANDKGEVIGFMVDISATATDAKGKFIGRIMPEGKVAQARNFVGKIGPWGGVFDKDGQEIGQLVSTGPIFDYRGALRAHGLKNGQLILLSGTPLGYMSGSTAFDNNGRVVGATLLPNLVVDSQNNVLGVSGINSVLNNVEERKIVSPFGYVYSADGSIDGNTIALGGVYSLAGKHFASLYPNGEMLNNGAVSTGKITQYGVNIDERNQVLGKNISAVYAVDESAQSLGILADGNLVLDKNMSPKGRVLPDGSVIIEGMESYNLLPVAGRASSSTMAIGFDGKFLGYVNSSGQVRDLGGLTLGRVDSSGLVKDNAGVLLGSVVAYSPAFNKPCEFMGVTTPQGEVRNYREILMGRVLPNNQIVSETGSIIGFTMSGRNAAVDYSGNSVGLVSSDGKVVNYNNENLGCINWQGRVYNTQKALVAKVAEVFPAMNFDGKIIGRSQMNGSVINMSGQSLGYMRPDGIVSSKTGMPLGSLFKYKFAFDNSNKFLGKVNENAEVIDEKSNSVGTVDYEGNVIVSGQKSGYALYDAYIYDAANNAIGYIAFDGTVMSFSNTNLGRVQKGFLLDRSGKVIGRGNRDYFVRDNINIVIGELAFDGSVVAAKGNMVGRLGISGDVVAMDGQVIATAMPLQFYEAERKQPVYDTTGNIVGYVTENNVIVDTKGNVIGQLGKNGIAIGVDGTIIGNTKLDWYEKPIQPTVEKPKVGSITVETSPEQYRRSLNIALTPDGDYLGDVLENGNVVDKDGKLLGKLLPDGLIVDNDGSLIGIEESSKNPNKSDMFVPAGTFGQGGAYGTGTGGANLGPGGGHGPGERYDVQRSAALSTAQKERRANMEVGKISTAHSKSSFDGMQKDWAEQGIPKAISSWRVNMSEMIFADKPIPAVIARSIDSSNPAPVTAFVERNVYAEEGRNIIIPAGSRIMGTLASITAGAEESSESAKVQISWERLVRPDGVVFVFQGITGDSQGRGGALGYLDRQLLKKYTLPVAMTSLTSATSYMFATDQEGTGETESSKQQAANDARQSFISNMNQMFQQILSDKTNIRPLTYVPAGTRIIVYPSIDLWLRTPERDAEASEMYKQKDVLIDDKKTQDKIATMDSERRVKNSGGGTAASSQVVYEAEETTSSPALIDDKKSIGAAPKASAGAVPPPPPPSSSSGNRKPSGSAGGGSVPQLF